MPQIAVDANVIIAARLQRDQNHDRGAAILQGIDSGTLPTGYVLGDVLEEIINYLHAKSGHSAATETLDAVIQSSGFTLTQATKSDFDTGRSLFRQYESLSLTDAIIVAAMQRADIECVYSFDDGFDGVSGITRLTTADNPFSE